MKTKHTVLTLAVLAAFQPPAQAETGSFSQALADSQVDMQFRYRLEAVDQDGLAENALANTLKSRFTVKTGQAGNWSALAEFDYVTELVDKDYNDTINGNTAYPVIADPSGADLNQAYVKYQSGGTSAIFGRQRINHNNQRFVGGVGWRQNEQTFDGVRVTSDITEGLNIDYTYSYKVNRIFGSKHPAGDLSSNLHLLNLAYTPAKGHKLAAFAYHMDFDTAAALSNRTLGLDYSYSGSTGSTTFKLHASYATQSDVGDNPVDYSADYYALDADVSFSGVTLGLGQEVLDADNGKGFVTPLATLHKFQGFSDKFLATPGGGIQDTFAKIGSKFGKLSVTAWYHQFDASVGSADYGSEIDLVAAYPFDGYKLLVKYAAYDAEELATDTSKLWVQVVANF